MTRRHGNGGDGEMGKAVSDENTAVFNSNQFILDGTDDPPIPFTDMDTQCR